MMPDKVEQVFDVAGLFSASCSGLDGLKFGLKGNPLRAKGITPSHLAVDRV